jgi:nucleotidyltransferase substrate binding protein (TIGR01987 family)
MDRQERLRFQVGRFAAALTALQEAVDTDTGDKKSRDSILLSFVFTFEMAWKALKEALLYRGAEAPNYAAGTLQAAFTVGLITAPDLWMDLREARNEVSHAYDQDKAMALASMVKAQAVQGFVALLEVLEHDAA